MVDITTFDQVFEDAAKAWNVDPMLLKAVALQESPDGKGGVNPRAVSPVGAQGMLQIMPRTQKDLGVTDPFDPVQAIFAGAKYLSEGLDKEGTPEGALLYYHGGPGWRDKYGRESAGYVPAVTSHYRALTAARAAQAPPAASQAPPAASTASTTP